MVSERILAILVKQARGEELTKSERSALYNHEYRQTETGKQRKAEADKTHKERHQSFHISFPREHLESLGVLVCGEPTAKLIVQYLLRKINEQR